MRLATVLACSVLFVACAETAIGPEGEGTPSVAEVVCEADGSTTVLTPEVLAQPDGVHVHVLSKLDEPASVGSVGFDVDPGERYWVSHAAPGGVDAACYAYSDHDSGEEPPAAPVEILDPAGLYLDGELECGFFGEMWSQTADFGEAPVEAGVVPLDKARANIGGLEADDDVRYSGYPSSEDRRVVVVRHGDVVASFAFVTFDGAEWVAEGASGCDGTGIRSI